MCRLCFLVLLGYMAADLITTTGAYTYDECRDECNLKHGYIVAAPKNILLPITRSIASLDGFDCACVIESAKFLLYLKEKGLDDLAFCRWYRTKACLGRMWLSYHGVNVVKKKRKSKAPKTNTSPAAAGEREKPGEGEECDLKGARELQKELAASKARGDLQRTRQLQAEAQKKFAVPSTTKDEQSRTSNTAHA